MPPCFATVATSAPNTSVVVHHVDRAKRHRLQRDAALPCLAHLGEHAARRSASASDSCRCGCAARRCRARRRSATRSPCAFARPRATSSCRGRAITAMRAPMCVPSGFCARCQIWPLSMWVCTSTRRGSTMPLSRSKRGRSFGPTGPMAAMRAVIDHDVAGRETVGIGFQLRRVRDETDRHARIGEAIGRDVGRDGDEGHLISLLRHGRACPRHPRLFCCDVRRGCPAQGRA